MEKYLRRFAIGVVVLLLIGCTKSLDRQIVGKWQDESQRENGTEFFVDHTLIATAGPESFAGKWAVVGERRLKVEYSSPQTPVPFVWENVHITGNRMTWDFKGTTNTFVKIR
jgi:hypothetical protein